MIRVSLRGHIPWDTRTKPDMLNTMTAAYYAKSVADVCLNCKEPNCRYKEGCDAYRRARDAAVNPNYTGFSKRAHG